MSDDSRIPILYLAPWVDFGGSDKGTIDWFRWLDRDRFRPFLITTQPSENRRIGEIVPYADEVWGLTPLMAGHQMPEFILDFIVSRDVRVIHIMNSRLAFELLPDLAGLDDPPVVVVQLHVEEEDRSGYVRLVSTRYGNLVDAFSVSSRHLAAAVAGYDVRGDRIVVIPTGVDADGEFCPGRDAARDLGPGPHVLYPGRLTAQKDPLLMVQVAAQVVQGRPDARFHVVGDGDLEVSVRAAVRRAGLTAHVMFHPPSTEVASWYAASDLLLMTSVFEGVPYVLYEAMAMGLASVVPQLPGNAELLSGGAGILVAPRDQPEAYATAVLSLLNGSGVARRMGEAARSRVRSRLSVQQMASAHAELYMRLLDAQPPLRRSLAPTPLPAPHRLAARPSRGAPRVTVVVPCFNHGRFLPDTLASIRAQSYPELEVIVVDDASVDPTTVELLARLDDDPAISVLRQPVNSGPSAARNAGIAQASGRYILPVDADNVLLPAAIASLVTQLQSANERVGFIYPNLQFFGNRHDYFQAPHFDLQTLRNANYCDTCSLIDRGVFDAGLRFAEDIALGHEDWDFFLTLATHGIRGEPAHTPTLRYRKTGFTRSDTVEYRATPFATDLRERHPALYPTQADGVNVAAAHRQEGTLKAVWQPAISLLLLEDVDTRSESGQRLLRNLGRQTMCDAEVIAPFSHAVAATGTGPFLRRLPPALPDRLTNLLAAARARYVIVVQRGAHALVAASGFLERLVHARISAGRSVGIAFADGGPSFPGLTFDVIRDPPAGLLPLAVALFERFAGPQVPPFTAAPGDEVTSIVASLEAEHILQWRHASDHGPAPRVDQPPQRVRHDPTVREPRDARDRMQRLAHHGSPPAPPAATMIRRWRASPWPAWIPPETTVLIRHKQIDGERRLVTLGEGAPDGYVVEHWLGAVQRFSPPGTARIEVTLDAAGSPTAFRAVAAEVPAPPPGQDRRSLGHVEQAALPLLQAIHVARVKATGHLTLVAGDTDVLNAQSDVVGLLGYAEAFPNLPAAPTFAHADSRPHPTLVRGLLGRRHVHGIDTLTHGRIVARLGQLLPVQIPGCVAARVLPDGTFVTDRYRPAWRHAGPSQTLRWILAPVTWRRQGSLLVRGRATARRATQALRRSGDRTSTSADAVAQAPTIGYLYTAPGPDRLELFSAVHPLTGDQVLTPFPLEATDMGYVDVTTIGFTRGVVENVKIDRYSAPWTSRFGLEARRG
ncbi:MAG: glycosyltransferase [Solirubrobacteraceae bacterium]